MLRILIWKQINLPWSVITLQKYHKKDKIWIIPKREKDKDHRDEKTTQCNDSPTHIHQSLLTSIIHNVGDSIAVNNGREAEESGQINGATENKLK